MAPRLVVLGGGTGGSAVANRLRRRFDVGELAITVVDADDDHLYQPGLLFVPFGLARPSGLSRSRRGQLRPGVDFRRCAVERVDVGARAVHLDDGSELSYDVLVVATGSELRPEETEGLLGTGWMESVFTFYDLPGARALAGALESFEGGRLVVDVADMPIKCPVAPLEFCFLADSWLRRRGMRERVELVFVTPLDGAFTKPVASRRLGTMLDERGIELVTEFNLGSVEGEKRRLVAYDGRELPYDLAVVVPLHGGAPWIGRSPGLGDSLDFVPCDPHTLQAKGSPEIFAVGDAAEVPTSKAGSVAHFQAEVVAENVAHLLAHEPLAAGFDGHANCFVESGDGKALLVDFNYDTEPLPGCFPGRVGLPLLEESRLCHVAKRLFPWVYWNVVVAGRDVPGLGSSMPLRGKVFEAAGEKRS